MSVAKASNAIWESRSDGTPVRTVRVDDPAAQKVFWDPRRQEILKALSTPASVKELSERLGEPPSRLYYHVRLLARHGFIGPIDRRQVRSNTETVYGLTANRFESELPGTVAMEAGLPARAFFDAATRFTAAAETRGARGQGVFAVHADKLVLTDNDAKQFLRQYEALVKEFKKRSAARRRPGTPLTAFHAVFPAAER